MSIEDASKSIKGDGGGLKNKLFFLPIGCSTFRSFAFQCNIEKISTRNVENCRFY